MTVRTSREGAVLVMRIDREARQNAIDEEAARALEVALDELEGSPALRVGVLTGSSTVFCAGTDLRSAGTPRTARGGEYGFVRRPRTKPVIAAVEGYAVGGGFELALACDLIVASIDARFALPEVRRGLVASAGGLFRADRRLPPGVATELLVAGTQLTGTRAYELGLANRLAEPGRALGAALDLADEVCAGSPGAIATTLAALAELRGRDEEWATSDRATQLARSSPDAQEGIAAFLEKRAPSWCRTEEKEDA